MKKPIEINYGGNISKQLETTILLVEKLQKEIAELKHKHSREMSREIYLLEEAQAKKIKTITASQKEEIQELKETVRKQAEEISLLKEENQALRDIINKNSGNSSKPP